MRIITIISGFQGSAVTIASVFDEKTGVLVVAKQIGYREDRPKPDMALVSNLDLQSCDFQFTDKHLRDAIRSYFTRRSQGMLDIDSSLARYLPDNRIEQDGVDESGRKYRIAPEIENGQIAVLATVAFIEAQKPISAAIDMANELSDFYRITSI